MATINRNFLRLPGGYLFSEISRRVSAYAKEHPHKTLIKLGIGDVTRPLPQAVTEAMHRAVDEMSTSTGFHGYGPERGYEFLREAIVGQDYAARGIGISTDEVFVSDGAKSDCGNIGDIFGEDNVVAVCDPVYPVYVDAAAMAGRAGEYDAVHQRWSKIVYMPCTQENGFCPVVPEEKVDLIYLCFPNNPTGAVASREQLSTWVAYANRHDAIILFDGAYEAFITQPEIPHSIYEIPGAKTCAIEFRSFSKTAGFTGTRCAYTIVPKELVRGGVSVNNLWSRRQCTKFNGVSYVVQRGAEAVYSVQGQAQIKEIISYYHKNATVIRQGLMQAGLWVYGGVNSPYIWVKTPEGMGSWEFFHILLERANVVTTPGAGFGPNGEGYIRVTAFGDAQDTQRAVERIVSSVRK